jgi:hypothetical protein
VLDELEYFRIQDELDITYHAADVHAGGGCVHGLALNALFRDVHIVHMCDVL